MKKDLSFLKENLIAHRGAHNIEESIPENTLLAFKKAIENNYIIELDVHLTKDGQVISLDNENHINAFLASGWAEEKSSVFLVCGEFVRNYKEKLTNGNLHYIL